MYYGCVKHSVVKLLPELWITLAGVVARTTGGQEGKSCLGTARLCQQFFPCICCVNVLQRNAFSHVGLGIALRSQSHAMVCLCGAGSGDRLQVGRKLKTFRATRRHSSAPRTAGSRAPSYACKW